MDTEPTAPFDDESFSKPGFDGRLQYYKVVGGFMKGIAESSIMNDYDRWFNLLNCLFDMVSPFIKKPDDLAKDIAVVEKKVYGYLGSCSNKNNQHVLNRAIESELHVLTRKIYGAAKHMLLPIQEDEDKEYSSEEFFRGSDM